MKTGYKTIEIEEKGGVAVFTMNNPPVNQLSPHFALELREAGLDAFEDDDIKAVILTGTGKSFVAGADIKHAQGLLVEFPVPVKPAVGFPMAAVTSRMLPSR